MDSATDPRTPAPEDAVIRVRLWASARAAAGVSELELPTDQALSLAEVARLVVETAPAPDPDRLRQVLGVCSVLIGEEPAHGDPADVTVGPGQRVEFLPPFAGG